MCQRINRGGRDACRKAPQGAYYCENNGVRYCHNPDYHLQAKAPRKLSGSEKKKRKKEKLQATFNQGGAPEELELPLLENAEIDMSEHPNDTNVIEQQLPASEMHSALNQSGAQQEQELPLVENAEIDMSEHADYTNVSEQQRLASVMHSALNQGSAQEEQELPLSENVGIDMSEHPNYTNVSEDQQPASAMHSMTINPRCCSQCLLAMYAFGHTMQTRGRHFCFSMFHAHRWCHIRSKKLRCLLSLIFVLIVVVWIVAWVINANTCKFNELLSSTRAPCRNATADLGIFHSTRLCLWMSSATSTPSVL